MWHPLIIDQIGESDCEVIGGGAIAQPSNTVASLAYVLVGIWILARLRRHPSPIRPYVVAFGIAVIAVGLGSVAFHGTMPPGARWFHDLANVAALALIAVYDAALGFGWRRATAFGLYAGTLVLVGSIFAAAPDSSVMVTGVLVGVVVIVEFATVRRTGRLGPAPARVTRLYVGIAVALVVALALNLLGRTGGPLCDPDSVLQLHALWHVLTAVVFGLWSLVAFDTLSARPVAPENLG